MSANADIWFNSAGWPTESRTHMTNTAKNDTSAPPPLYLIIFTTAFAAYMSRLDSHVVNISLPAIALHFGVGTSKASAVILANLLTTTSTLILAGKLGDRIGLARLFKWGYGISILSSLACSLAPNFSFLVAARAVQGIGSAILVSMSFALISAYIPHKKTGQAFGMASTAAALGMLTGAPLGGLITQALSWRWAFLLTPPAALAALLLTDRTFPDSQPSRTAKKIGLFGGLSLFTALSALVLTLHCAKFFGAASTYTWGAAFLTLTAAAVFVRHEKTSDTPLLQPELLQNRRFMHASVMQFFACMMLTGSNFFFPFYLIVYRGLNSAQAGAVLMLYSITYVVFAPLAGRQADRSSPPAICVAGLTATVLAALSFPLILKAQAQWPGWLWLFWLAVSYSFTLSPNNTFAMRGNKGSEQGMAAGIYNTMSNLGMVLGVLLMETAFAWKLPQKQMTVEQLHTLPQGALASAFTHAYLAGGAACLAALGFAIVMMRDNSVQRAPEAARHITPLP